MTAIVHFPHPAPEPRLPAGTRELPWNSRDHRRKFLYASGAHRSRPDGEDVTGPLAFWGEWEPESELVSSWQKAGPLPTCAWRPYWRQKPSYAGLQNTDPFVFGDCFLYGNCRQYTNGLTTPTRLTRLAPGSIILFGSTIGADFTLDTLLVVRDAVPYDIRQPASLAGHAPVAYVPITMLPIAQHPKVHGVPGVFPAGLRLYRGATPDARVDGMFSFTPCAANDAGGARFARPVITLPPQVGPINPASKQAAKTFGCSPAVARSAWDFVVAQVVHAGLHLGVRIDLPSEVLS